MGVRAWIGSSVVVWMNVWAHQQQVYACHVKPEGVCVCGCGCGGVAESVCVELWARVANQQQQVGAPCPPRLECP